MIFFTMFRGRHHTVGWIIGGSQLRPSLKDLTCSPLLVRMVRYGQQSYQDSERISRSMDNAYLNADL